MANPRVSRLIDSEILSPEDEDLLVAYARAISQKQQLEKRIRKLRPRVEELVGGMTNAYDEQIKVSLPHGHLVNASWVDSSSTPDGYENVSMTFDLASGRTCIFTESEVKEASSIVKKMVKELASQNVSTASPGNKTLRVSLSKHTDTTKEKQDVKSFSLLEEDAVDVP